MPKQRPLVSLRNAQYAHSFSSLPTDFDFPRVDYGDSADPSVPSRIKPYETHWVLLGEIVDASPERRPTFLVREHNRATIVVSLVPGRDVVTSRVSRHLKVGNVVVLIHPLAHLFPDGKVGVQVVHMDEIAIWPISVADFIQLNADSLAHNWLTPDDDPSRPKTCHGCGEAKPGMTRCAGCRTAWYCSRACQARAWDRPAPENAHKAQCRVLRDPDVRHLFRLDFRRYGQGFGFGPTGYKGRPLADDELAELTAFHGPPPKVKTRFTSVDRVAWRPQSQLPEGFLPHAKAKQEASNEKTSTESEK